MRKLVAVLACRAGGTRLFGKPVQNLGQNKTILAHLVDGTRAAPQIAETVLAISEGEENLIFQTFAREQGLAYVVGDQQDVLWRMILGARACGASDVFRVTTESPFVAWELLDPAWRAHCEHGNDLTDTDIANFPIGSAFELISLAALERVHQESPEDEIIPREHASQGIRQRSDFYRVEAIETPEDWRRPDLRLTADNPEDLALCREVFNALYNGSPQIPMQQIIDWLNANPEAHRPVEKYVRPYPQPPKLP